MSKREFNHGAPVSHWEEQAETVLMNGRRDPLTAKAYLTAVR